MGAEVEPLFLNVDDNNNTTAYQELNEKNLDNTLNVQFNW